MYLCQELQPYMEYSQNFENVYFSLSFFFSLHRGVCGKLKVKVKVARSCQTLCDPMDYTVHGILQARILEWVAFPSPGDLPNPGIKPKFSTLQRDSLPAEPQFNQPEMETTPAPVEVYVLITGLQESPQDALMLFTLFLIFENMKFKKTKF